MENCHGVVMLGTYTYLSVKLKWSGENNEPDPPSNKDTIYECRAPGPRFVGCVHSLGQIQAVTARSSSATWHDWQLMTWNSRYSPFCLNSKILSINQPQFPSTATKCKEQQKMTNKASGKKVTFSCRTHDQLVLPQLL